MRHSLILLLFFAINFNGYSQKIPFTIEDRDRIIHIQGDIKAVNERINSTNQDINHVNENINSLKENFDLKVQSQARQLSNISTLMFIILGFIISLVGFILWDRKTALSPIQKDNKNLKEQNRNIFDTLEKIAKNDVKLVDVLKSIRNPGNSIYDNDIEDYELEVNELVNSSIFQTA